MTQYIDKAAVVAEIERRIKINKECMLGLRNLDYYQGKVDALSDTIYFIDTLEVKEVDFEKQKTSISDEEILEEWIQNRIVGWNGKIAIPKWGMIIAKHFFELGLRVSQPTTSVYGIEEALKENGIDPESKEADVYREAIYKIYDRLKAQKGE